MQVNVAAQVLRRGVQHQTENRCSSGHTHPFGIGGKFGQRLRRAGKQRADHPMRVRPIQGVQAMCRLAL